MDDRVKKLVEAMRGRPELFEYFDDQERKVGLLIQDLKSARERRYLTADELYRIARIKSTRRAEQARKNLTDEVAELTKCAFTVSSPVAAVAILTALRGVGVPTASAILAWTFPTRFGVIDRRAWAALQKFKVVPESAEPKTAFSFSDWRSYHEQITEIAAEASQVIGQTINPQAIDLWLYHHDKRG